MSKVSFGLHQNVFHDSHDACRDARLPGSQCGTCAAPLVDEAKPQLPRRRRPSFPEDASGNPAVFQHVKGSSAHLRILRVPPKTRNMKSQHGQTGHAESVQIVCIPRRSPTAVCSYLSPSRTIPRNLTAGSRLRHAIPFRHLLYQRRAEGIPRLTSHNSTR